MNVFSKLIDSHIVLSNTYFKAQLLKVQTSFRPPMFCHNLRLLTVCSKSTKLPWHQKITYNFLTSFFHLLKRIYNTSKTGGWDSPSANPHPTTPHGYVPEHKKTEIFKFGPIRIWKRNHNHCKKIGYLKIVGISVTPMVTDPTTNALEHPKKISVCSNLVFVLWTL